MRRKENRRPLPRRPGWRDISDEFWDEIKATFLNPTISKVQGESDEWLKSAEKKTVKFITQSESQHGREGNSHHVTVIVWHD